MILIGTAQLELVRDDSAPLRAGPEGRRKSGNRHRDSTDLSESEEERRERHFSAPLALSMCRKVRFVGDRDFSLLLDSGVEKS